jgi:hypothetical protein
MVAHDYAAANNSRTSGSQVEITSAKSSIAVQFSRLLKRLLEKTYDQADLVRLDCVGLVRLVVRYFAA